VQLVDLLLVDFIIIQVVYHMTINHVNYIVEQSFELKLEKEIPTDMMKHFTH
jgi:hypothetical protein